MKRYTFVFIVFFYCLFLLGCQNPDITPVVDHILCDKKTQQAYLVKKFGGDAVYLQRIADADEVCK